MEVRTPSQVGRCPLHGGDCAALRPGSTVPRASGGGHDWIFAARVGYYSDPDHDGLAALDSKQNHVTVGGGVVVKNQLQVDVAGNFAKHVKEGLISFVVRF